MIESTLVENNGADGLDTRRSILGMDREGLAEAVRAIGEPSESVAMRARQLFHWLYHRGARDFGLMSSISSRLRDELTKHYRIEAGKVIDIQRSTDGTRKWLVRFGPGIHVETVHIPENDRGAICVSSQVGCTLNCRFCHTGTQRLVRNLEPGEIIAQLFHARDQLGEWPTPRDGASRLISNVVMMGMGEPLYNYENVSRALKLIMDGEGIAISRRRITLSTAGVVPMIERCGAELGVNLAISLHAVRNDIRDELVPINRKYPISDLLAACRRYPSSSNARRITFEYVMLKEINDSLSDARELVRLIAGIPAKVNLIPFNPWPGSSYECSSDESIRSFAKVVNEAGYASPVRVPRGRDIMAACGQLKSDSQVLRANSR